MLIYRLRIEKLVAALGILLFFVMIAFGFRYFNQNDRECLPVAASEKERCYSEELHSIYKKRGFLSSVEYIKEAYANDEQFAEACHSYMHLLGQWSYKDYKDKSSIELSRDTSICGYGFYHGFMIELFKSGVNFLEARKFCYYANEKLGIGSQLVDSDCFHGVGHGVTDYSTGDIKGDLDLKTIASNSAEICAGLAFGNWLQLTSCMNGVYHSVSEVLIDYVDKNNPLAFCESQGDDFEPVCLSAFGVVLMNAKGESFAEALKFAALMPEQKAILVIQPMSGYQGLRIVKNKDYEESILACAILKDSLNMACIRGLLEGVRDFGEPGNEANEVINFCSNHAMSELQSDTCFRRAVETFDAYFGDGNKAKLCNLLDEEKREKYCL